MFLHKGIRGLKNKRFKTTYNIISKMYKYIPFKFIFEIKNFKKI